MEVVRCPLLLTLLAGGLGPTPGQGKGEQAWVPITTTGAFIIQLTLRGGPGPGRAKGDGRAMRREWVRVEVSLNPPSSKKARADTLLGNETKRKEDRKGGNNRAHRVRARKVRGHSSQGILSPAPSLHFPGPASSGGEICSRFASSSRKSSEFNCTQLWSAPSILSTPFSHHIFP